MKVYRAWEEKSGSPYHDNAGRNRNRALHKVLKGSMRIHARNRKRRKYILSQEYPRYAELVHTVGLELKKRRTVIG